MKVLEHDQVSKWLKQELSKPGFASFRHQSLM